jgi:hypothetical protein
MKYASLCELVAGGERLRFKYASNLSRDEVTQLLDSMKARLDQCCISPAKLDHVRSAFKEMESSITSAGDPCITNPAYCYNFALKDLESVAPLVVAAYYHTGDVKQQTEKYHKDPVFSAHPVFSILDKSMPLAFDGAKALVNSISSSLGIICERLQPDIIKATPAPELEAIKDFLKYSQAYLQALH